MLNTISIGVRAFQFLFSAVIVGLSATLLKQQVYGDSPVTTRYSVFTGALGMIIGAVGGLALFVDAIPPLVTAAIDGVGALLLLGGGIALGVGLKGVGCKTEDADKMYDSPLLNEGCVPNRNGQDGRPYCGILDGVGDDVDALLGALKGNCQKALADEVFQFLTFALLVGLALLGWMAMRRGGGSRSRFVA